MTRVRADKPWRKLEKPYLVKLRKMPGRSPTWVLYCLVLVAALVIIGVVRYSGSSGHRLFTIVAELNSQLAQEFTADGQTMNIQLNIISSKKSCGNVPQWPYAYQEAKPHQSLRERLYDRMYDVAPPFIKILDMPDYDPKKIPRIIHQMWKNTSIPENTKQWVEKWEKTNPGWTYMFWTDKSARDFMSNYYPMLLPTYDEYKYPVQKSDMFRYVLMLSFGGVYADIDIEPLKDLEPIRNWAPCILSTEPDAHVHVSNAQAQKASNYSLNCNAIMACRPMHPFFFFLLSELMRNMSVRRHSRRFKKNNDLCPLADTLGCTGPWIATISYVFYKRSLGNLLEKHKEDNIIAAEARYFLPTFADHAISSIKQRCLNRRIKLDKIGKKVCESLKNNGFKNNIVTNDSFTNHHWFDSYHFKGKRTNIPLDKVLQNVTYFPEVEFEVTMRNRATAYGHR